MAQSGRTGRFLYGIFGTTCVIKAVGNINYHIGGSFDTFVTRVLADNSIEDFLIDLTEAEYIDSTNLGLLARIQVFSADRLARRPTVISTNDTINGILANLGFDRLFTILDASSAAAGNLTELPSVPTGDAALGDVILSAHRYLMNTNDRNAIVFREIVELLEKDVRKRHKPN